MQKAGFLTTRLIYCIAGFVSLAVLFLSRERASHCSIEWVGVTWGDEKEFDRIGKAMGKLFNKKKYRFQPRNFIA